MCGLQPMRAKRAGRKGQRHPNHHRDHGNAEQPPRKLSVEFGQRTLQLLTSVCQARSLGAFWLETL